MEPSETERWRHEGVGDNRGDGLPRGGLPAPVSIECRQEGASGVVVISGELALDGGDAAEVAVAGLVANGVTDVSVDAGRLTFIDSSGLAGLIAARALVV